jgi:hypothetical protein
VQKKVVALIGDLAYMDQYAGTFYPPLRATLRSPEWCARLAETLTSVPEGEDDAREKVLRAMDRLSDGAGGERDCRSTFLEDAHRAAVRAARSEWASRADAEDDEYARDLVLLVDRMNAKLDGALLRKQA